jgi:hypothetical protein
MRKRKLPLIRFPLNRGGLRGKKKMKIRNKNKIKTEIEKVKKIRKMKIEYEMIKKKLINHKIENEKKLPLLHFPLNRGGLRGRKIKTHEIINERKMKTINQIIQVKTTNKNNDKN